MAARRVDDAAGFHDRYGVPRSVIHELLDGAQKDFEELTQDAPATPTLRLQRARLDRLFAHLYEVAGDTVQQRAMALRALERLATVPVARHAHVPGTWFAQLPPADKVRIERILALEAAGQAKAIAGDASGARELFLAMAREADAARANTPTPAARSLASNARSNLARLAYEAADLETALKELQEAAALLAEHGGDAKIMLDRAKVQSDAAEMLLELGRHEEALAQQQGAVETLAKAAATPATAKALGAALARRGDMRLAARRDLIGSSNSGDR
jgi:tetratricopeptide (TPR) repeat protein